MATHTVIYTPHGVATKRRLHSKTTRFTMASLRLIYKQHHDPNRTRLINRLIGAHPLLIDETHRLSQWMGSTNDTTCGESKLGRTHLSDTGNLRP